MATIEEETPPTTYLPSVGAPEYQCGAYGQWELKEKLGNSRERGYFNDFDHEPPGHYIVRDDHIWMSTSRLERESHAIHVTHATGTVVVCGVGMGMYLYNIAGLERVERILAVDIDPATIDLVRNATSFETWPGKDKIRFVNKDALKLTPADIGPGPVDYLYVDIWPELGNPEAIAQTQAIQAVVKAKTVGWWGQELDFIEWLYTHWPKQNAPTLPDLVDFMESIDMPIEEHSPAYLLACAQAGKVFSGYGATPSAKARRKRR
jgi:hypothetical protein